MTSSCCQVSARSAQDAGSLSVGMGHRTVRRSSSAQISTRHWKGSWPRSAAMSRDDPPAEALVRLAVRVADDVPPEVREPPEDARLLAVGARAASRPARPGRAAWRSARGRAGRGSSPQPGIRFSAQKVPRDMFIGVRIGMVSATTRPPALRARSLASSWRGHALGDGGVDGQDVPVQGPSGRRAHLHEQVDLVVAELVEAARDDRLDLRALVLADRPATARAARRAGRAGRRPAVRRRRSGWRTGWWRSPRPRRPWPRGTAAASRRAAPRSAARRRRPAPITYRRSAQCPTMKPGVDGDPPLERVQILPEAAPAPGRALLQRDQRHALDLGHHPARVVGVLGRSGFSGASVNPQLPAGDGGHPVVERGRGVRVPEQLGVVVRVRIDEPGREDEPGGVLAGRGPPR